MYKAVGKELIKFVFVVYIQFKLYKLTKLKYNI